MHTHLYMHIHEWQCCPLIKIEGNLINRLNKIQRILIRINYNKHIKTYSIKDVFAVNLIFYENTRLCLRQKEKPFEFIPSYHKRQFIKWVLCPSKRVLWHLKFVARTSGDKLSHFWRIFLLRIFRFWELLIWVRQLSNLEHLTWPICVN